MPALETIVLAAPGFWGLNTQDSPLDLDVRFAAKATNAVIDKKGRIAARKGTATVSTNGGSVLGSSAGIEFIKELLHEDGTKTLYSAGNNKVFTGAGTTLTDITPGAATITANNWIGATLSNKFYMFQSGHTPLVSPAGGTLIRVQDDGAYTGTVPQGDVVLAAYGRLFVSSTSSEKSVIYWSDLLNGVAWDGGSTGSIDLRKHWPQGYDEIVALIEHNKSLIVFGKDNILIFGGADSPATMELVDVIQNIGCVARDTVDSTGRDIMYLSSTGMRTLGRTIQENSAPIGDSSRNIDSDLKTVLKAETGNIRGHYNQDEGFYILSFPSNSLAYVFDTRFPLVDMSLRTTKWTTLVPLAMERTRAGDLLVGSATGIEKYSGYLDLAATFELDWETHPLSFGVPGNLKFLKDIQITTEGGSGGTFVVKWGWNYISQLTTTTITLEGGTLAEFGIGEFNIAEYSSSISLSNDSAPAGGSGKVLVTGLTATINNKPFAIQQFEVQATIGRVL